MFITVSYRDVPDLSLQQGKSSDTDLAVERSLLVNPDCPVRIMLEYIRNKCKLGIFTTFDLCDESGALKRLFNLPTHTYATDLFEHKRNYYIVVLRTEADGRISVLPQLNRETKLYQDLKTRVRRFLTSGDISSSSAKADKKSPKSTATPSPPAKGKKK